MGKFNTRKLDECYETTTGGKIVGIDLFSTSCPSRKHMEPDEDGPLPACRSINWNPDTHRLEEGEKCMYCEVINLDQNWVLCTCR